MKRILLAAAVLVGLAAATVCVPGAQPAPWPRVKTLPDGTRITAYQPQVDNWGFYVRLDFRLAVEILEPGAARPVPAALQLTGETTTDLSTRTVVLYNLKILKANFPAADDATAQRLTALLARVVPAAPMKLSVDAILAHVTTPGGGAAPPSGQPAAPAAAAPAQPAPPVILHSQTPAVLVIYDGEPKFAPIEGTGLRFAVNTNWDVFQENDQPTTYLLNGESWLQAPAPTGPWAPVTKLPRSFWSLPAEDNWAEVRKHLPGKTITKGTMPTVFVSVQPAELILLDGAPKFKAVTGTKLAWVANTDSDLFRHEPDGTLYYLVSGRWFRASSLDGPWT